MFYNERYDRKTIETRLPFIWVCTIGNEKCLRESNEAFFVSDVIMYLIG